MSRSLLGSGIWPEIPAGFGYSIKASSYQKEEEVSMRMYQAETVDDYIANSDEKARPIMKEIRTIIKSAIPKAEEKISWGMPFYRYHGAIAGFSVFKNYVDFGFCNVFSAEERKIFEDRGYVTKKKIVQIRFDQPVPAEEIKRIVEERAKENEAGKKEE
jgi:uncharacterized protein YdhG (YjbR/CyaY superfamily)